MESSKQNQSDTTIIKLLEDDALQEKIHRRFASFFGDTLSMAVRMPSPLTVQSNEVISLDALGEQLPKSATWIWFQLNPTLLHGFVIVEPEYTFRNLELFYGGNGALPILDIQRDYSEIELRLINRIVIAVLEDLEGVWRSEFHLDFNIQTTKHRPTETTEMMEYFSSTDRFRLICFELTQGSIGSTTTMKLCYPLQPIPLGRYLVHEHPQSIALILGEVPGEEALAALQEFSEELQADVVYRLATMLNINLPTIRDEIKTGFSRALIERGETTGPHPGGFTKAVELFYLLDEASREKLFQSWSTMNYPDLGIIEKIKEKISQS